MSNDVHFLENNFEYNKLLHPVNKSQESQSSYVPIAIVHRKDSNNSSPTTKCESSVPNDLPSSDSQCPIDPPTSTIPQISIEASLILLAEVPELMMRHPMKT